MKNISLTFKIHHPFRLKKYRFTDIGNDSYYYDDFENERMIRNVAEECYLPTNEILSELIIKHKGNFKVSFSISGTAIDLFSLYAPEVIESFQKLSATGCVEFLGGTFAHSLISIKDNDEFKIQVKDHSDKVAGLFGQQPKVFINTGMIYSDAIGAMISETGFKAVLTEGARQILKWRSPNCLYSNPINPDLKILLSNTALSEAVASGFSNPGWTGWQTNPSNYISVLNQNLEDEKIVNLVMDYEIPGRGQRNHKGIYNFLKSFPRSIFEMTEYKFMNPSEIIAYIESLSPINVPEIISSSPYENGLSSLLGNDLQQEAYGKLYGLLERINHCNDRDLLKDWMFLQSSDHFYYMADKKFQDKGMTVLTNPYENFYEAFMNYMNVLTDFTMRVNSSVIRIQTDFVLKRIVNQVAI